MVVHLFRRKDGGGAARSVAPTVAPDERIYAIGDVHGRYDLLIPLLKRLHDDARLFSDQRRPRFVFLGDVIDRGEESRLVLDALSALTADPTDDMVLLLGNHEAALLAFLRDPGRILQRRSGSETLSAPGWRLTPLSSKGSGSISAPATSFSATPASIPANPWTRRTKPPSPGGIRGFLWTRPFLTCGSCTDTSTPPIRSAGRDEFASIPAPTTAAS